MLTCTSDIKGVQVLQYKLQRASFDLGKGNFCQATLLQPAKQQTPEIDRPGGQKCPVGLHGAVTTHESNILEAAAKQQLFAVTDQLLQDR